MWLIGRQLFGGGGGWGGGVVQCVFNSKSFLIWKQVKDVDEKREKQKGIGAGDDRRKKGSILLYDQTVARKSQ